MFYKEKITASLDLYQNKIITTSLNKLMNNILNNHLDYINDTILNQLLMLLVAGTKYEYHYIKNISDILATTMELPPVMSVWEFMGYASNSRDNDLDLCRQVLLNDKVVITPQTKFKLARAIVQYEIKPILEGMKAKIKEWHYDEELNPIRKVVFDGIAIPLNTLNVKQYNGNIGSVDITMLPPCMEGILEDILTGNSPNHYARRSFCTFYFTAMFDPTLRCFDDENGGLKNIKAQDIADEESIQGYIDEMNSIFEGVDDYNKYKTTYYLLNNIGYNSSNGLMFCEYCKKFKSDSNLSMYCNPDATCNKRGIIHPLDYYIDKSVK